MLRRQLGNNVNVEVDTAPGLNLGEIMNEMRQKYEILAQKNLQEAKEQFERQVIVDSGQMGNTVRGRETRFSRFPPFCLSSFLFFFPLLCLPSILSSLKGTFIFEIKSKGSK